MNGSAKSLISIILAVLLFLFSNLSHAQISLEGGVNYCDVKHNNSLKGQDPLYAFHTGVSVRWYPLKKYPKLSVQNEILFNRKGYRIVSDENYRFELNYISFAVLLNYSPLEYLSVSTGAEISGLMYTNVKQGLETFNNTDVGLVFGISCFDNRRLSVYTRVTCGITPVLDYYSFDKLGNFTGEIHLRNVSLSLGLKINMYDEKIRLYK